jgi:ferrous iron transport protein A
MLQLRTILNLACQPEKPGIRKASSMVAVSLDEVSVGSTVRVRDVAGGDAVAIRLLEMGVTPGVEIRLVGKAPFGDPLELELRGYRLSIRRQEAARVAIGDR